MKIVIIGGVAAGASAAARARRLDEHADILLLQSGPDVSFASCGMPYFIGGEITDRGKMAVQTPESLYAKLNLDVRVNIRVEEILVGEKKVIARNENTGQPLTAEYDELVLAGKSESLASNCLFAIKKYSLLNGVLILKNSSLQSVLSHSSLPSLVLIEEVCFHFVI